MQGKLIGLVNFVRDETTGRMARVSPGGREGVQDQSPLAILAGFAWTPAMNAGVTVGDLARTGNTLDVIPAFIAGIQSSRIHDSWPVECR